jgi:hypothetical protein
MIPDWGMGEGVVADVEGVGDVDGVEEGGMSSLMNLSHLSFPSSEVKVWMLSKMFENGSWGCDLRQCGGRWIGYRGARSRRGRLSGDCSWRQDCRVVFVLWHGGQDSCGSVHPFLHLSRFGASFLKQRLRCR